jgi:hypothetical protein
MTRMKTLCMALFAVFALAAAVSATSAMALELPDVHVLSGESYPALGEGKVEGTEVGVLETELGEKLTSSTVKAQAELLELSSLGPGTLTFTGVFEPKSKTSCHTSGDVEGTVKLPGEYHVVDTSTSPLTAAILILFKELVVECNSGKLKIKVRSPALVKLEKVTSGTDVESYGLVSKCTGKGKQELKNYLNDAGESVKGVLTANFGLGFETACENVKEELIVKSNKMIDFLF